MLQAIRSNVTSWFVKILFVLLIASFAVWGIGDLFRGATPSDTVVTVGDAEVSGTAINQRFTSAFSQEQVSRGGNYTRAQAVEDGLLDEVITNTVDQLALSQFASQIGLQPPEQLITEQIRRIELFADPQTGQFSRDRFISFLRSQGLSEAAFVADRTNELNQTIMTLSAARGAIAPEVLVNPLYRLTYERRVADIVSLDESQVDVPDASESELRSFHSANPDLFQAPEYRDLSIVLLTPQELADELAVDEVDVRDWYEQRIDSYATPETRTVTQVTFDTGEAAQAFIDALDETGDWDAALNSQNSFFFSEQLEGRSQSQLGGALGEAVFALDQGAWTTEPIRSDLGFSVARVEAITPGDIPEFEAVAEEVEADLRLDRAYDVLFEMANELEDELAGGASLAEAADTLGLPLVDTPPLSRQGEALNAEVPDIGNLGDILDVAFDMQPGESSLLEEAEDGSYFIVRVDGIEPPRTMAFGEVEQQVADAWRTAEAERLAAQRIEQAAERLQRGQAAQVAANAIDGSAQQTDPLLRDGSNASDLPPGLIEQLFTLDPGGVGTQDLGTTHVAYRLAEVIEADPANPDDENWMRQTTSEVENGLSTDLIQQFREAARAQIPVDIDREAIERLILGE